MYISCTSCQQLGGERQQKERLHLLDYLKDHGPSTYRKRPNSLIGQEGLMNQPLSTHSGLSLVRLLSPHTFLLPRPPSGLIFLKPMSDHYSTTLQPLVAPTLPSAGPDVLAWKGSGPFQPDASLIIHFLQYYVPGTLYSSPTTSLTDLNTAGCANSSTRNVLLLGLHLLTPSIQRTSSGTIAPGKLFLTHLGLK